VAVASSLYDDYFFFLPPFLRASSLLLSSLP